jgi:hypothetical protein
MNEPIDALRRTLLKTAVAGAGATLLAGSVRAGEGSGIASAAVSPPGKPGDFDFLSGNWKIRHRRLKTPGSQDWDEFDGEATCWGILGGVVSVEELRIPARNFNGMGLRVLDVERKIWSDFWVNARSGVVVAPGVAGHFVDGAGVFESEERDGDTPLKVRGVWDRITPRSCRWYQESSRDGGQTWELNWEMAWTRA